MILSANGMPFSTYDRDNDGDEGRNCAEESQAGWWFDGCYDVGYRGEINLNAEYATGGLSCENYDSAQIGRASW